MNTKITVKPSTVRFSEWDVFENGVKIAEVWFVRDRLEFGGRIEVTCDGKLTLTDGRSFRLNHYSWWRDVRRDIAFLITLCQ